MQYWRNFFLWKERNFSIKEIIRQSWKKFCYFSTDAATIYFFLEDHDEYLYPLFRYQRYCISSSFSKKWRVKATDERKLFIWVFLQTWGHYFVNNFHPFYLNAVLANLHLKEKFSSKKIIFCYLCDKFCYFSGSYHHNYFFLGTCFFVIWWIPEVGSIMTKSEGISFPVTPFVLQLFTHVTKEAAIVFNSSARIAPSPPFILRKNTSDKRLLKRRNHVLFLLISSKND